MVEDKKSDLEQSKSALTGEQIVDLVKHLAFNIERQIYTSATDQRTRDDREKADRVTHLCWQKVSTIGGLILSLATVAVLAWTLVEVIGYTKEAHNLTNLTQRMLDADTRPYIQITPYPADNSRTPSPKAEDFLKIAVYLYNWGKTPARTIVLGRARYSRTRLSSASEYVGFGDLPEQYIWPGTYVNGTQSGGVLVYPQSSDKLTYGDLTDINKRLGYFYIEVKVTYGNGYITRICDELPLDTDKPMLNFELCSAAGSNCTDADKTCD